MREVVTQLAGSNAVLEAGVQQCCFSGPPTATFQAPPSTAGWCPLATHGGRDRGAGVGRPGAGRGRRSRWVVVLAEGLTDQRSVGTVAHPAGPTERHWGLGETERTGGLGMAGEGCHRPAVPLRALRPPSHVPRASRRRRQRAGRVSRGSDASLRSTQPLRGVHPSWYARSRRAFGRRPGRRARRRDLRRG